MEQMFYSWTLDQYIVPLTESDYILSNIEFANKLLRLTEMTTMNTVNVQGDIAKKICFC